MGFSKLSFRTSHFSWLIAMIVTILLFVLTIIFSLIQSTILPFNLVFLLVLLISFIAEHQALLIAEHQALLINQEFSFLFAFLAGLILDLVRGEDLGISPVLFLLMAGAVFLLKKAFFLGKERRGERELKLPSEV